MIPPSFATVSSVNSPAEIFQLDQSNQADTGARVSIDNLAGSPLSTPSIVNLVATLDNGISPPDWQSEAGPSLRLEVYVDLRDRMNSRLYLNIYVHHLNADVLADWGLNLESSTIKLDSVTSDVIRMFDS